MVAARLNTVYSARFLLHLRHFSDGASGKLCWQSLLTRRRRMGKFLLKAVEFVPAWPNISSHESCRTNALLPDGTSGR